MSSPRYWQREVGELVHEATEHAGVVDLDLGDRHGAVFEATFAGEVELDSGTARGRFTGSYRGPLRGAPSRK